RTTEDIAIKTPVRLELTIDGRVMPEPPSFNDYADYELPTAEWTGKTVTVTARAVGSNGKAGQWATPMQLPILAEPERPTAVKAEPTPDGVALSWQGSPGTFAVLRRESGERNFTEIGQAQQNSYLDRTAEFGKDYVYLVQRRVPLGGGR